VVVINTGYATRRGRIIRKILTRTAQKPDFYDKGLIFLVFNLLIGVILYFSTLYLMLGNVLELYVGFRFLDVIAWCMPPSFPVFFNLAYTFSLVRLKYKNIFGT
jgi:magnesium-transporting ATPase (P-type)